MASQMNRIDNRSSYSNHLMNPIVTTTPTITTKSIFPIIDEENGYKRNYFKGTIPSSTSSPFFTSNNQRILTSQEISNNDNIINDNINERYTKHTTTIPTTTNNHLELSKSPIQKSMEPTSPSVDYLLFDAPPWMKQSKMKNSKFINHNTNYHSTISSNIITAATTTTTTTTTATTTRKLSSPPLSNIKDTKMNIDNITIIRKDNNNNNHNVIRSSSPRSNGSFRFVKSGSCRFPEKNPKLNPPSYMQKLDDIVIEDEMNTESFITSKNNKFNLTKNLDHNDHWITHDPSHKFTPISSPTFIKTTNIPSNEIIQSKYKENKNVLQSNINKSIYERTIHSTPSSPTMERSILIKPLTDVTDDDVILRNPIKSIGLPPRPLRSPLIRLSNRCISPVINRIPIRNQSMIQDGDITKSKRIDPITGEIQHITSRTRSYTDLNSNALITEVEENIHGEGDTEVRVVRRKTRKLKPNTFRESRSVDSSGFQRDSRTHQRTEETKTEKHIEEELNYQCSSTKVQPQRTSSQMNISGPSTMTKTAWLSETNLRNSTTCKQPPMYSTYSAHKENMRRMQEQRRTTEDWQASNRQLHDSRSVGSRAVLEEMETITLQPIGRGVHDLEPPTGSIARSVRATTPSGLSTFPTLLNRPHSSAGRIDLSVSGIKRSISKDYYSPIRMQRSTIDIPYSQTTQALISPPINRRLVGFANLGHSSRISSINKSVLLPTIHHDPIIYGNHIVNNQSPELINQSYMNRNSYARQTLTQNIQEITQKQRLLSPNQQYYATPSYNKLANRSYAPGLEQQDGFRTIATTNYHREMHTSGPQSPYLGTMRQNSQYEATPIVNRSIVQQSVIPFSPNGSLSGTNIGVDIVDGDTVGMRQVLDTSKYWYLPGISRPDVIALLRDKEPGSFVIRNSNTYADSFGLALKIPPSSPRIISNKDDIQSEWVRHFLIGTVPMHDGRGNGVHLRGFSSDPTFPSLAAFVHYHIHKQGALPCTLRLPLFTNQTLFNQQRTTVNEQTVYGLEPSLQTILPTTNTMSTDMLYLGSVEVDRLENMNAAIRGIGKILSLAQTYSDGLPKRCEVQIKVIPHDGITFTEKYKRAVWRKTIKPNNLLWCGLDPENREFNDAELRSKGMYGSKILALVARKQRFWLHENVVYVFCEIDHNHSALNLVRFINTIFPNLRD
uniref:SH2 domain-containing protein n=1 Tax=Schistosoma mansoni TaxID=6183 RepID=A0A5K4F668_SCHMA